MPSLAAGGEKPAVLRVASPEMPTQFNPYRPLNDAERQALDLLFEPLIAPSFGANGVVQYRPVLAEAIPVGQGIQLTFQLRPGSVWSNGAPVTANDVRHALRHLRQDPGASHAWATLVDQPQLGATPGEVRVSLRQGLVDPWELFAFPVVPQLYQGRDLVAPSDLEFGKRPIGSGPFMAVGPTKINGLAAMVFRKNPHHRLASKISFDEIHWFAAQNAKDLEAIKPDVVLGIDADATNRTTQPTARVWYVAPNHRHPLLGQPELRRFLGLALERDKIVGGAPRLAVAGLTPRDSWSPAPKPRVPEDLYRPEVALGLAQGLAKEHKKIALTFKFPAEQSSKMAKVIEQWQTAAQAGGLDLKIQPIPLSTRELADAVARHDFDLALLNEDHGDSLARLTALFDRRPEALAPGGSNVAGVDDNTLSGTIVAMPLSRQFPALRSQMQNVHVHLVQTMPLIPLWRHQATYSLGGYRVSAFDPLRPFADMTSWRK